MLCSSLHSSCTHKPNLCHLNATVVVSDVVLLYLTDISFLPICLPHPLFFLFFFGSCVHRVIVGGLLGLGAIIWGVVSLIKKSGGLGITILIIGLFLLWTTYNLYRSITSDQIIHHPIFAPDCYRPHRREHTTSYVGGGRNTTVSSPSSALTSPSSRNKSNRPRGSKVPQTKKNDKSKKQKKVEVGSSADTSDDSFGIVDLELGENKPTAKKPAVKKKPKKKKPTPSGATATATKKKKKPSPS